MSSKKQITATTTVLSDECIFTWTIKNYRLIKLKVGERIESPKFDVGSDNKQYFKLHLYPEGQETEDAGYISLYLNPVIDSTKKPHKLVCRWTLSAINGKKVILKLTDHHDFATNNFKGRGSSQFYKLENIDKLISAENTVTIQCELEFFKEYESSLDCPDIIDGKNQTIGTVNFDSLFHSKEFSDVNIITSDANDIPAHKVILATASPVFRAMFTHDMLENKENSVKITNTTKNIVIEMLRFIYTGQINGIETDMIIELLAVADKYQIDSLKIKCGKMLCADLSTKNAVDILVASHKCKVKNLEDEAIKFVTNHTQLHSGKLMEIDDLDLLKNVMQYIFKKL
ncbi:hypothetical protein TKK_0003637 [Trichogramma kaykai]